MRRRHDGFSLEIFRIFLFRDWIGIGYLGQPEKGSSKTPRSHELANDTGWVLISRFYHQENFLSLSPKWKKISWEIRFSTVIKNSFLELTRTYWIPVRIFLELRWHRTTLIKFHYFHQFHLREDAIECNFHDSFPLNEIFLPIVSKFEIQSTRTRSGLRNWKCLVGCARESK